MIPRMFHVVVLFAFIVSVSLLNSFSGYRRSSWFGETNSYHGLRSWNTENALVNLGGEDGNEKQTIERRLLTSKLAEQAKEIQRITARKPFFRDYRRVIALCRVHPEVTVVGVLCLGLLALWHFSFPISFHAITHAFSKVLQVLFDILAAYTCFKAGFPVFGLGAVGLIFFASTVAYLVQQFYDEQQWVTPKIVLHWTQFVHLEDASKTIKNGMLPPFQFLVGFIEIALEAGLEAILQSYATFLGVGLHIQVIGFCGSTVLQTTTLFSLLLFAQRLTALRVHPYDEGVPWSWMLWLRSFSEVATRLLTISVLVVSMRPPHSNSHDVNPMLYISALIFFIHALEAIMLTGSTRSFEDNKYINPFLAMVSVLCLPPPMFKWLESSRAHLKVMRVAEMFMMYAFAHFVHGSHDVVLRHLWDRPVFLGIFVVAFPVNLAEAIYLSPLAFLRAVKLCIVFSLVACFIFWLPYSTIVLILTVLACCCALRGNCVTVSAHLVVICVSIQALLVGIKYFEIRDWQTLGPPLAFVAMEAAVQVQLFIDSTSSSQKGYTPLLESVGVGLPFKTHHETKASTKAASAIFACIKENKLKFFDFLCKYTEMTAERHPQTGQLVFMWARDNDVNLQRFKDQAEYVVHASASEEVEHKGEDYILRLRRILQGGGFILLKSETMLLWMSVTDDLRMLFTHTDDVAWQHWADEKLHAKQVHGDGLTALHIAVNQGSMDLVRKMLNMRADPSLEVRCNGVKVSPLWMAIRGLSTKRVEIVEVLLDAKADAQAVRPQHDGLTMLLATIQLHVDPTATHKELEEKMDEHKLDIKSEETQSLLQKDAVDPITVAEIEENRVRVVKALVDARAALDVDDPTTRLTALHLAVQRSLELVKILLQGNADPAIQAGERAQTPLLLALGSTSRKVQSRQIASELLKAQADASQAMLETLQLYLHVDGAGLDSHRPRFEDPEICARVVRMLVEVRAAVNVRNEDTEPKYTALHYAAGYHSAVVVKELLALRANAEPPTGENEESPLWLTINELRRESPKIAQALLRASADANSVGKQNKNLLIVAAKQISFLVGARVRDNNEGDPESVCDDCVRELLDARAKVNVKEDKTQHTALHYAAQHSLKLVTTLLERRAEVNIEAAESKATRQTPLSLTITPQGKSTLASMADRPYIAEALLRARADPNGYAPQMDSDGKPEASTVLQLAVQRTPPFRLEPTDEGSNAESKSGAGIVAALLDHKAKVKNLKQPTDREKAAKLMQNIERKDLCAILEERGGWFG